MPSPHRNNFSPFLFSGRVSPFGFNGKENDAETSTQDYGMRIYNPGLGRFLSVDPLTKKFAYLTPYQFASNSPIEFIDLDGTEAVKPISGEQGRDWNYYPATSFEKDKDLIMSTGHDSQGNQINVTPSYGLGGSGSAPLYWYNPSAPLIIVSTATSTSNPVNGVLIHGASGPDEGGDSKKNVAEPSEDREEQSQEIDNKAGKKVEDHLPRGTGGLRQGISKINNDATNPNYGILSTDNGIDLAKCTISAIGTHIDPTKDHVSGVNVEYMIGTNDKSNVAAFKESIIIQLQQTYGKDIDVQFRILKNEDGATNSTASTEVYTIPAETPH